MSNLVKYTNDEYRFTVSVPIGWKIRKGIMGWLVKKANDTVVSFVPVKSPTSELSIHIRLSQLNNIPDVMKMFDLLCEQEQLDVLEKQKLKISDIDAYEITYRRNKVDHTQFVKTAFVHNGRYYLFQFASENLSQEKDLFDKFVQSFRFQDDVKLSNHEPMNDIAAYDRAIAMNPNNAGAHCNRGVFLAASGEHAEALKAYSRAIEIDPTLAEAYFNRGVLYQGMRSYDKALSDYSKAIELDMNYVDAYSNRGTVYRSLQQYEAAQADYEKALSLAPDNPSANLNMGALLGNQEKLKEALIYFEKAALLGHEKAVTYVEQVRQKLNAE